MESQIQQMVSNIPGNIVQYCATSDIRPDISPAEITKKFLEIGHPVSWIVIIFWYLQFFHVYIDQMQIKHR